MQCHLIQVWPLLLFLTWTPPPIVSWLKYCQSHTKMSVTVASEAMSILANHVYVIPPDSDLTMENYRFKVISPRIRRNKQVDLFFISLAEAMGVRAVGIILSGYDGDGTEGCKHIKANGGNTFTQDISAEVNSHAAQRSGSRLC
ncbi:MAG: chemotaxis protein CheB [Chitinophagaceae bacterium]